MQSPFNTFSPFTPTDPLPDPLPLYTPGSIPEAAASFDDVSGWALGTEFVDGGGQIETTGPLPSNTDVEYNLTFPSGDVWTYFDQIPTSITGVARGRVGTPYLNGSRSNLRKGVTVEKFSLPAGYTKMIVRGNTNYEGAFRHAQVVDMNATLAKPAKIILTGGQSLMAAQSTSHPLDVDEGDGWRDARCLYICPVNNATYGIIANEIQASCVPLQTQYGNSTGVSPAHRFQAEITPYIDEAYSVVIVQCAVGGTSLVGNDAEWNPDGNTGDGAIYYDGLVAAAQAALTNLPVGSTIEGLLWSQGQSDNGVSIGTEYPPAFTNMLTKLRTALSLPNMPCAILGPNRNSSTWDDLGAAQATMDKDSGHANALANVIYVPGPLGAQYDEDGTHLNAAGSRLHGVDLASAWRQRIMGV